MNIDQDFNITDMVPEFPNQPKREISKKFINSLDS